jgi:hypothetical protein
MPVNDSLDRGHILDARRAPGTRDNDYVELVNLSVIRV